MCGVSADRCTGFSAVRWQSRGSMVGLLVGLFVTFLLSFLAMPDLRCCCFLSPCNIGVTPVMANSYILRYRSMRSRLTLLLHPYPEVLPILIPIPSHQQAVDDCVCAHCRARQRSVNSNHSQETQ